MDSDSKVPDHEDVPLPEQITQTFESSTAVIKFSGTCLGSDSESFSSESDEERVKTADHRECFPDPSQQENPQSDGRLQSTPTPSANWTEESWRSDSGFNSDTATAQGQRHHEDHGESETRQACTDGVKPEDREHYPSETRPTEMTVPEVALDTGSAPKAPAQMIQGNSLPSSPENFAKENASPLLTERSSRDRTAHRERFNPFNRVPFIHDDHFDNMASFPSVSGTSFSGDRDDFGTLRHENQSTSSDTDTEVSLPSKDLDLALITNEDLGITEDHFSHPEGCFGFSRQEELEVAIELCKESVKETSEHSEQRRELVNRLVQLRMKLLEIKEGMEKDPDIKQVLGHKFVKRKGKSSNHQCDTCNSIIWGMLQSWHRCYECGFSCHSKCLNFVKRQCASTKARSVPRISMDNRNTGANTQQISKRGYIMDICPEIGLAAQNYRCAECRTQLSFSDTADPRQCDYDGHYYCSLCHWNDTEVIPARVIHNWDFNTRKVCRQSKQFLKLMQRRAVLCVQDLNPMLFNYVEELSQIKKLREEILVMKMYFLSCRKAMEDKLLLQLQNRPHFVDSPETYSLQDLIDTKDSTLLSTLSGIHGNYAVHIKIECPLCQARGFICELCNSDEVLYPFDMIAAVCSHCSAVFHRDCFFKHSGECPKCKRLSRRSCQEGR
ncbi:differentially expressed in FDCP 8 homolog A-like isoform X3 [Acanthaster planci]|uniref:Differentially expressed in FDCP 8 homolog A-like isoform X3 n=1 Tax=Acanthaster planci TaxID=133434 RepID=A0A8B7XQ65_ACAPL|nr:differentially expressed in FDCP 8 homolog A-like isoform X3 [Acanthaster planci]